MKRFIKILILMSVVLLLSACNIQPESSPETDEYPLTEDVGSEIETEE